MISTTFYYYYEVSKNTYLRETSATTSTSGDDAQNIAIDIDRTNGNGQNTMAVDDISRSDNSDEYDLTFEPIAPADHVWTLIKYTPHQVAKMIGLVEYKKLSVRKAAELTNISNSRAHQLYKQHKEDSSVTPGYKAKNQIKRPRKIDLTDEQRQIVDFYVKSVADQNANVVKVKDAQDDLCQQLEGLKISQKTVKERIQQTVAFTLVLPPVPPYTATGDILESRSKFAGELMSRSLDYIEGCMFISEGAVVMSETLVVEARTTRSEAKSYDLNIFLCLTAGGVLAVSQEAMVAEAQRKQRQMEKVGKAKGTAPDHLIQFASEVFKTISQGEFRCGVVMANRHLFRERPFVNAVRNAGHFPLYMPNNSTFLDPCRPCWEAIRSRIRRTPLTDEDSLASRIKEAAETITAAECIRWVSEAKSYIDRCLAKEQIQ